MTVKEIFDLRKQGKIEEAYEAIRPIYRVHKGKYTTLCMFRTAVDMLKLRLEQGRVEESEKIFLALKRLVPSLDDDNKKSATGFMRQAESMLIKSSEKFRKRYFAIRHAKEKKVEGFSDQFSSDFECGARPKHPVTSLNFWSSEHHPSLLEDGRVATKVSNAKIPQKLSQKSSQNAIERFSDKFSTDFEADRPTHAEGPLSASQTKVLDYIKSNPGLRAPMISEGLNIPSKSIERHVKALIAHGLIEHRGSKKTGGYFAL